MKITKLLRVTVKGTKKEIAETFNLIKSMADVEVEEGVSYTHTRKGDVVVLP